ncbi:MAG: aminopeptidase P family protein [Alphaproteobacteria bacterium]|nr:aminopeptidase P family protein [Alphaproteobacteria bacterium]
MTVRTVIPDLSTVEFERRQTKFRAALDRAGIDCALVHSPAAICYFTGFETVSTASYACLFFSTARGPELLIWDLELAGAQRTSRLREIATYPTGADPAGVTREALSRHARTPGRIAIELEATAVAPRVYRALIEGLDSRSVVDAGPLLADVRRVKSNEEIACFRSAAGMTDLAMMAAAAAAGPGVRDNDMAAAAVHAMTAAGSEYSCLPPIVSAGEHSGVAHSTFKNLVLASGDAVVVEVGACVRRYCAPLMRTVAVGALSPAMRDLHAHAVDVLAQVLDHLRVGRTADEVARAAWTRMPRDCPDLVFHGVFAYAVGCGFPPSWADGTARVRLGNQQPIEAGMVLHLPVAFRRPSMGGVSVSETVVVTEKGVEALGTTAREVLAR